MSSHSARSEPFARSGPDHAADVKAASDAAAAQLGQEFGQMFPGVRMMTAQFYIDTDGDQQVVVATGSSDPGGPGEMIIY